MMGEGELEAFDRLLEELRGAIAAVNKAGGAAQTAGRLAEAEQALARAKGLDAIRKELEGIRERLKGLVDDTAHYVAPTDEATAPPAHQGSSKGSRPRTGGTTTKDEFRIPILRALVALGGSAPLHSVLERVFREMKGRLLPPDLEQQPNRPEYIRWEYSANWCRLSLRHDGLLKDGSQRGIWEISDAGRRWLANQEKGLG